MTIYNYSYRCSDIARLFIGTLQLNENITDKEATLKVQNFINNIYKDKKCNLTLLNKMSNNESITYNEEAILNTSIIYK